MSRRLHIRDATAADAGALVALQRAEAGTTQLVAEPGERLLVAEQPGGRIVAALRLKPGVGLQVPRPLYHVGCVVHAAPELGLFQRQRTLLLGHDLTGATELADLAWSADDALPLRAAALRTLLRGALLLRAAEGADAQETVVAELPGVRDAAGQSPFWKGLGRHFYGGDPAEAIERQGAQRWRTQVSALLPRHPLYVSFLPAVAQAAIGQHAPACTWLRELLQQEGLRHRQHVRVDDAGPVLEADFAALPAVQAAAVRRLGAPVAEALARERVLVHAGQGVHLLPAAREGDRWQLCAADAARLGLHGETSAWTLRDA